ncbi:hypothetical protein LINPERPRIM_LOCUS27155 [Linum perenne]
MADQSHNQNGCEGEGHEKEAGVGLCGLLTKKKVTGDGGQNDRDKNVTSSDVKHGGPMSTLADHLHHRSDGASSSEEEEDLDGGGEKKRKKKGLKDKIKKKMSIEKEAEVTIEIVHDGEEDDDSSEEKKGFMEKIMDKLPLNGHEEKKPDDVVIENENGVEKGGILDKIKEKIQGVGKMVNGSDDHERKKED